MKGGFFFLIFVFFAASDLDCSTQESPLRHVGPFLVAHRHSACGPWAQRLWPVGSAVVARGLSCSAAREIPVPHPGIEPMSAALQGGFLTTGFFPPGKA